MSKSNDLAVGVFEGKDLRKIFDSLCISGDYRIRPNDELYELYRDVDIVQPINIHRWLSLVVRMDGDTQIGAAVTKLCVHGSRSCAYTRDA